MTSFASTSRSFKTLIPYLGTGQHFLNSAVCILTWTNLSFTIVGQMLLNMKKKNKKTKLIYQEMSHSLMSIPPEMSLEAKN